MNNDNSSESGEVKKSLDPHECGKVFYSGCNFDCEKCLNKETCKCHRGCFCFDCAEENCHKCASSKECVELKEAKRREIDDALARAGYRSCNCNDRTGCACFGIIIIIALIVYSLYSFFTDEYSIPKEKVSGAYYQDEGKFLPDSWFSSAEDVSESGELVIGKAEYKIDLDNLKDLKSYTRRVRNGKNKSGYHNEESYYYEVKAKLISNKVVEHGSFGKFCYYLGWGIFFLILIFLIGGHILGLNKGKHKKLRETKTE